MRRRIFPYLLLASALLHAPAPVVASGYDFRIVIDVSGSMKESDPQNLRIEALRLLNGLIPDGSRAGVWTYGRYVDAVVKWGRVDDDWRRQADLGARKVHANARMTNLESALARASVGWREPDDKTTRILLLLTDGGVEASVDPEKNAASRGRVLSENLAALRKAAVQVHAIALSDASDEPLLKRLALETGGSFTAARSADDLQSLFYRAFERVVHPETVALEGEEFLIDPGIGAMKLLVFRSEDGSPTILIPPDSPAISAAKPRAARWRSGRGFELVTLDEPEAGSWRIDAGDGADSRVLVESDLRLAVNGLPAFADPGDAITVAAELFDRGKKIRKNSFLRFVDFSITHIDVDGSETRHAMTHTSMREDKGRYLYRLGPALAEGSHGFIVSAAARSFNRSMRFDVRVQRPVETGIEALDKPGEYEFRLRAREEYLKPDGLVAEIEIEAPDGVREGLRLEPSRGWLRARIETGQQGTYRVHVKVSAQNHRREIHDIDLGSFPLQGARRAISAAPENNAGAARAAETAQTRSGDGIDWRRAGIFMVGINLSLILLAIGAWLLFRRRGKTDEFIIEDEEFGA